MRSFIDRFFSFVGVPVLLIAASVSHAAIDAEMEGLEVDSRDDGTFLVGGPTYFFDRILGAGGLHSESEMWSPAKLRQRLLFNRMSVLPGWDVHEPSIWMKTGNELGDMIYQDFITSADRPSNRTPILEGGFRTPSFKGFWVTARAFQDDHFSTANMGPRKKWVDDGFSFFGENYPLFSTVYAGFGYQAPLWNASVLAGEEYLWLFSESSRWIPVHYKPRVEARADVRNLSVTAAYEDAEFQNHSKKEKGSRKEWNGSLRYRCGDACRRGILQLSAGLAFRRVDDDGTVYTELDDDRVLLPFMELRVEPTKRLTAEAMFAVNDRDWLVQDSVEVHPATPKNSGVVLGIQDVHSGAS